MVKNQVTLGSVNARVEQLAEQFKESMEDFRNKLMQDKTANSKPEDASDLLSKFSAFETSIKNSLEELKDEVNTLKRESTTISSKVNATEFHKNMKILVIHGIKEKSTDVYKEVLEIFQNKLNVSITMNEIDRCFRLGKNGQRKNPRPLAVQFCQRWVRDKIFTNKRKLKGSNLLISEMLTAGNLNLFKTVKAKFGNAAWTFGGVVYVQCDGNRKMIRSESDVPT